MASLHPYSTHIVDVQLDELKGTKADEESKGRRVEIEQIVLVIRHAPDVISE